MPTESPRIAELRRRIQADPASIAFAQLAEEYRRAGNYEEAVRYCRQGLGRHPGYLSARVTLGRALTELGLLEEAAREFEIVLRSAPDNLAAIRGMAEIHHRRGVMPEALDYYKRALQLARFDPELEDTVDRIGREMGQNTAGGPGEGLSFEQARSELLDAAARVPAAGPPAPTAAPAAPAPAPPGSAVTDALIDFDEVLSSLGVPDAAPPPAMEMLLTQSPAATPPMAVVLPELPAAAADDPFAALEADLRAIGAPAACEPPQDPLAPLVAELEAWLDAILQDRGAAPAA